MVEEGIKKNNKEEPLLFTCHTNAQCPIVLLDSQLVQCGLYTCVEV